MLPRLQSLFRNLTRRCKVESDLAAEVTSYGITVDDTVT
jgi:hypothetical protein